VHAMDDLGKHQRVDSEQDDQGYQHRMGKAEML
jgi:hypothetical protein